MDITKKTNKHIVVKKKYRTNPTFLPQKVGVEAQVVDAEVQPSLPRHLALPVAAGVVVDQLLLLGHPKQLPELGTGLLELVGVVVLLDIVVLVELCDDPLRRDGGEKRSHEGRVVEQKGSTPTESWSREGGKLARKKRQKF